MHAGDLLPKTGVPGVEEKVTQSADLAVGRPTWSVLIGTFLGNPLVGLKSAPHHAAALKHVARSLCYTPPADGSSSNSETMQ